ncbi:hypothetical protein MCOR25_002200 [Pyricularia grisea]|nr:hypothetical protein MCOR25_002200 [Pyricularia grisea]
MAPDPQGSCFSSTTRGTPVATSGNDNGSGSSSVGTRQSSSSGSSVTHVGSSGSGSTTTVAGSTGSSQ